MELKHVPFVEFNPRLFQQLPVFLHKGGPAVMLLLSLNVFDQLIDLAPGARKRTVSLLPVGKAFEDRVLLDPKRRASFNVLDEIR